MRRLLFGSVLIAGILLVSELGARAGLWLLARRGIVFDPVSTRLSPRAREAIERWIGPDSVTALVTLSPDLGWRPRPGLELPPLYRINSQGIRGDRTYSIQPSPDTVRIAAFGDSFTFGNAVNNASMWTAVLERRLVGAEVINFGVPVYGVDQAYLRYLAEGAAYRPEVVLIGFIAHNLARHVNRFRPFYANGSPMAKPRFRLEHGGLVLEPNPLRSIAEYQELLRDPAEVLPSLGQGDYHFETRLHDSPWDGSAMVRLVRLSNQVVRDRRSSLYRDDQFNPGSEAFAVTVAVFDRFVEQVRADGREPLILLFPTRGDLTQVAAGLPTVYAPLTRVLLERGYPVVDLQAAFAACGECDLDAVAPSKSLHYSELGNRVVGEWVAAELQRRGITGREALRREPRPQARVPR